MLLKRVHSWIDVTKLFADRKAPYLLYQHIKILSQANLKLVVERKIAIKSRYDILFAFEKMN